MNENEIGTLVLAAAIEVHRELGPGLLKSVYEVVLPRELSNRGLAVERQVPVPIVFKGIRFDEGFRADLIVTGKVLLELKSVEQVTPVHSWKPSLKSSWRTLTGNMVHGGAARESGSDLGVRNPCDER
ncbi:MAG: hypothetical protein QOF48_2908 [Verrucomicrobiota bacterium]|jgi:GxxExxY protein